MTIISRREAPSGLLAHAERIRDFGLVLAGSAAVLAGSAAVSLGVAALMGEPKWPKTGRETRPTTVARADPADATVSRASTPANPRTHERREIRYVVKPGDTLWGIAAAHYEDVAAAMSRIKKRNGLRRDNVLAGEALVLPAGGRRSDGEPRNSSSRTNATTYPSPSERLSPRGP